MRKIKIRNCQYAINPISNEPLFCDVYALLDDNEQLLFHENLWLFDMAKATPLETVKSYASDLLSFVRMSAPLGGWAFINPNHMTGYLHGELFQSRKYRKATMQRHISTLKQFYKWQERKGYLEIIPDFEWGYEHLYTKNNSVKHTHHVNQHSFHELFIEKQQFYDLILPSVVSENEFIRLRDQLCLLLGYECGTRAHEVLTIDTEDVRVSIQKEKNKNEGIWGVTTIELIGKGAVNRDLLLPPELCEFIWNYLSKYRNYMNNGLGPLICTKQGLPLKDKKHASTVFKKCYKHMNTPRKHQQGYHRLRKSFGTNLVQECYDNGDNPWVLVPRRLGHKSLSTTMLYIQFDALRNNRSFILNKLHMMDSRYAAVVGKNLE